MRGPRWIELHLLAVLSAAPASAQRDIPAFLARARDGTAVYQDRAAAIADGFRALGPDAPAMGQHWIHPGRVLSGVMDAARPAGLTYIMRDDKPMLAGVFYVLPLGPGARLPEEPAGARAWHFHNGDLSEEAVLSQHDPMQGREGSALRIAVLHAWVWSENPEAPFAPENWALPYARLGLPTPEGAPESVARGLSLATEEGSAFLASRVRLVAQEAVPDLEQRLLAHGKRVRARLGKERSGLSAADIVWLDQCWQAVVDELIGAAAPATRQRVRELLNPHGR